MIAADAPADLQASAVPADAGTAARAAAEAALQRALPLDSWFLFVSAWPRGVRVTGLARDTDTAERVRQALRGVPGIDEVDTDLLCLSDWPRAE